MSILSLRLPQSIHQNAKLYAQREGISVNQLAATALAEKLAALAAEDDPSVAASPPSNWRTSGRTNRFCASSSGRGEEGGRSPRWM